MLVLNKGLNFSLSHIIPNSKLIDHSFTRFERLLQLKVFFADTDESNYQLVTSDSAFNTNHSWWPPHLNKSIKKFCLETKQCFLRHLKNKKFNLSFKEIKALKLLRNDNDIVIKKCDKSGGIAIFNKSDYIKQVYDQIFDPMVYSQVFYNDTIEAKASCDDFLFSLMEKGFISNTQYTNLTTYEPTVPVFYGIPKVHKKDIPLRPIVSQINGPSYGLNKYVDKLLYVAEKRIPFLIQDTPSFLRIIEANKYISPNSYLVTMDVVSLYTNIPLQECIEFVCEMYEETLNFWSFYDTGLIPIPVNDLKMAIHLILSNCTFSFNNLLFKQKFGTTMGAASSVKLANIFMYKWLQKYLHSYNGFKPEFIVRLVDDCFFLWPFGEHSLKAFFTYINECHQSIKFETTFSQDSVVFLDTVVYNKENTLYTKVYIKPTDRRLLLHYHSHHPRHVFKSIVTSQILRYKRIISEHEVFLSQITELKNCFVLRGYPVTLFDMCFDKCLNLQRNNLLLPKSNTQREESFFNFTKGGVLLPLILPHYVYKSFNFDFMKLWERFINKPELAFLFCNLTPSIIFNKSTTIGSLLCKSKVSDFDEIDNENIRILFELTDV